MGAENWLNMAAVSLLYHDLVWGIPDWTRLQNPLVLMRSRIGVGDTGLRLCNC